MQLLSEMGGKDLLLLVSYTFSSVLHQAVVNGHVGVVRLLIGVGGQRLLFLTCQNGATPLHVATSH